MSQSSHEAMAAEEQTTAAEHENRYDPEARQERERCRGGNVRTGVDVCWGSVTNPTAEHLKHAEDHRKAAAEHRAAAQALREAESRACGGIPAADRDESPFDHREDITGVEPLYATASGRGSSVGAKRLEGAVVTFRAVPGMTAQWLQRVVDCHLARNASLGHDVPEMPYCPLVPKGATATVTPTQSGFAVAVRGDSSESSAEIWRRAQTLDASAAR